MEISEEYLKKIAALGLSARETQTLIVLVLLSADKKSVMFDMTELRTLTGQSAPALSKTLAGLTIKRAVIRNSKNKMTFNF